MPTLSIDQKLLRPKETSGGTEWRLWEKKNLNIHRGLLEWMDAPSDSVEAIAGRVRAVVKSEFKPGWLRGFGFGTILHLKAAPPDFSRISEHIDTRNKARGVWQWAIVIFEEDKVVLGLHTWLHGHLRPVYDSVLLQLESQGYQCHSTDAAIDPLIATLIKVAKVCRSLERVAGKLGG